MQTRPLALILNGGLPAQVELTIRESEAAPGRLKVGLKLNTGSSGNRSVFAADGQTAEVDANVPTEVLISPEFRLEMN
jgi:hypothetical protein